MKNVMVDYKRSTKVRWCCPGQAWVPNFCESQIRFYFPKNLKLYFYLINFCDCIVNIFEYKDFLADSACVTAFLIIFSFPREKLCTSVFFYFFKIDLRTFP